jgi:hypothetical protein
VKPVNFFKKLGAALATGLLALGIIAGTATAANATSSEINRAAAATVQFAPSTSGEIT